MPSWQLTTRFSTTTLSFPPDMYIPFDALFTMFPRTVTPDVQPSMYIPFTWLESGCLPAMNTQLYSHTDPRRDQS